MLKLIFLLMLPFFLAESVGEDIKGKRKIHFGKSVVHSLLFGYVLFVFDVTLIFTFFSEQYAALLSFIKRRVETVEDLFLFVLLFFVQLLFANVLLMLSRIIKCRSIEGAFRRITTVQKKLVTIMLGGSLIAVIVMFTIKDNAERRLVMNEVCSRNDSVQTDENGNYNDYIELYNPSGWKLLLTDFLIADNQGLDNSLKLGEVTIPAGGYYIVWIGSTEEAGADFGISASGETIYLARSGGEILDSVTVPRLERNMAFARAMDGAEEWKAEVPTPLAENDERLALLNKPEFSAESGFYDEDFLLSIEADEGEKIYYTLDGSIPDENATLYTEEIMVQNVSGNPNRYRSLQNVVSDWDTYSPPQEPVDKAFIVRAVAMDSYGNTSDVVTKTYFVDMEQYRNGYVLSLVSDPDDLFGDDGIYVTGKEYDDWYRGSREAASIVLNFLKSGREAEIETTVALFRDTLLMEQQAGLRIQGASQRHGALKRFSVFARKEYSGSRYFDYELFGERMHSFFMRPDFEDALIHKLVADRSVGTLDAVEAAVFLDGEFWYNTYLREKYSEDYLAFAYGVDREKVCLEERIPDEIYSFLEEHDLSKQEDYEKLCELIEVQSYIDYLATNIYMCNMDGSEIKNCRLWKTTVDTGAGYSDGRWRWLIYDMDSLGWNSIGYYQSARHDIDSFAQEKQYAGIAYNQETVYKALKKNPDFCRQFVLTFMDLANENFSAETIAEAWEIDMSWNDGFFEKRFDGIVPAMAKEFGLQGTLEELVLAVNEVNAGYVTINTITPDLGKGSWVGSYYTDYPVILTAVANEGYELVGWTNGEELIKEAQISVQLPRGGCHWEAVFEEKERR